MRRGGNRDAAAAFFRQATHGECAMKGVLLWLIGIPIPIIILLYIFNVF